MLARPPDAADAEVMYAVLSLINRLVDTLFPPAGGTNAEIDAKFADLVARYHAS